VPRPPRPAATNGLLLTPPRHDRPQLRPRTAASATRRWRWQPASAGDLERLSSLLLDIDTSADLDALRDRLTDGGAPAARTRAVLSQDERKSILSIVNGD